MKPNTFPHNRVARLGLWRETARSYLRDHGFVQDTTESFGETLARVLGIGTQELKLCLAEGAIGQALSDRFGNEDSHR